MNATEQQLTTILSTQNIEIKDDEYIGYFKQFILKSVYQPIFSFAHESHIGYEALLRITDSNNKNISPTDFFSRYELKNELLQLEIISRTIHILNFFYKNNNDTLLFLNINPHLISNGNICIKQLLEFINEHDIPPTRIVIEFIEESFTDTEALIKSAKYLRQSGCIIAIDDFGAGHSNFNRVWDLRPNIVKLDKSLIQRIRRDSWFQNSIASLVELLHESESLVLIEGIENEDDAKIAHDLNVDLHQGYFFGKPKSLTATNHIENHYFKNHIPMSQKEKNLINDYLQFQFNQAATCTQASFNLNETCQGLLSYPSVIICYLLNENGYQISEPVYGEYSTHNIHYNYGKLGETKGVNWSRRIYFQNAIAEPMTTQCTKPYLSLTSGHICITLSIAIKISGENYVLCCDVKTHNN